MMRNVHFNGPPGSCRWVLEEIIADIDNGLRVEDDGFGIFRRLKALELGLVPGLI